MHDNEPVRQIEHWLARFNAALARKDVTAVVALFEPEGFWRDMAAFTWNIETMEGHGEIAAMLEATMGHAGTAVFRRDGTAEVVGGVTESMLAFETGVARGRGHVRLRDGRCWTLLSAIAELKGHEERRGPQREPGVEHGARPDRRTWLEQRSADAAELGFSRQPYCLVIGGGQGGIGLGARLKRLGVPTIILERNPKAGDSWRNRYKSLCLHDPVWYDHMPYLPFPDHWPVFSPKDKLGDWLEMYVKVMELDYWTSSTAKRASYDEAAGQWSVEVEREGRTIILKPKQLVLATGMSGVPNIPRFPGADRFAGEQMHSSRYTSGEGYRGKRCVIVGANNSAHDIAADLWEHGANVTMIQRSPTIVVRSSTLMELGFGPLYSEAALARGITTDLADLKLSSMPHRLMPRRAKKVVEEIAARDRDLYAALDRVGFMYDFGEDATGIHCKYVRRGAGYYIDVGASDLIADGRVALKSRVEVERMTAGSVVLGDGSELPADLVVYATGFGSMNGWAAELISQQVADKVGKCWGVGSGTAGDPGPWEGELRNMWKPTQQPGLWFHGGNLYQSRVFSLILALQLKARAVGIATPVHGLAKVHHLT